MSASGASGACHVSHAGFDRRWHAELEAAALAALPAVSSHEADGWLYRLSAGGPKRANAVYPLATSSLALDARLEVARARFAAQGEALTLRLCEDGPDAGLDAALAARGFAVLDPSLVLWRESAPAPAPGFVRLEREDWLRRQAALEDGDPVRVAVHADLLRRLPATAIWGALVRAGRLQALGLAVPDGEWAGLFDILTLPAARRQGCARELIAGLAAEASRQGARRLYLQCIAANAPARALYQAAGFTPAYRYWYRRA